MPPQLREIASLRIFTIINDYVVTTQQVVSPKNPKDPKDVIITAEKWSVV